MHKTWKRWVARLGVLASVPVVGMLALTGAANAAIDPSTSAAVTSGLDETKTLIVTVIAVGFFAIVLAVIGIRIGAKWMKKAAGQ